VVSPELGSTLRDILVDLGLIFNFVITFPGCMEFYTLDSLLNCCLVSLACGGWFGHEVFLDVVLRREVTDVVVVYSYCIRSDQSMTKTDSPPPLGEPARWRSSPPTTQK